MKQFSAKRFEVGVKLLKVAYAMDMTSSQVTTHSIASRGKPLAPIHQTDHWLPILLWCIWLLLNWLLARPDAATPPAVRWMLLAIVLGMMLLWPAWQLSLSWAQPRPTRPSGEHLQLLLQLIGVLLVLQVVLWPMRLTAGWSTEQTLWLGGILSGWMLVAGWMTAIGCQSKTHGGRILTMLLLVTLVLGEPLVRWLLAQMFGTWPVNSMGLRWIGPIDAVQALRVPGARWSADKWAGYAWGVLGAGVMGWLILLLLGLRPRREARIVAE